MADETPQNPDEDQVTGDRMIVATSMLKAPKAVTAVKILPRTIEWERLAFMGAGAILALILYLISPFPLTLSASMYVVVFGAVGGYVIPYLSPLEGESMLTWFTLQGKEAAAKRVNVNGRWVKMYVGTYPLKRVAMGRTRLMSSGILVKARKYDERGYPQLESKTSKQDNPLLQQQKLRAKEGGAKKTLKASTSLSGASLPRKEARKQQQLRAQPRLPKAGQRKNTPSLTKPRKRRKQRKPRA